jgi:NAD(P)-dependent dehydrogenase (short-subunit alcohol dehydrogenase family)
MALMDGLVAIVTGAGRGIGRGEAIELARQGASVIVGEVDEEAGREVVEAITRAGGSAALALGDCSDVEVAAELVATAVREFGRLDALINNAGILRDRTLSKMTPEEWDAVIRVHLRGHYAPTHAAVNHWRSNEKPGRIVCTSSTSGLLGNFGQSNYGAAKAGIAAFSSIVAHEGAKYGIGCNAIAPAARTRMTEGAYGEKLRKGLADERDAPPAEEFDFWDPDNVAPFVVFLASPAAAHISGKVFGVQGDAVELYQPWTSVAVIRGGGARFDPECFIDTVGELFEESGITPTAENGMARLRFSMTNRA